MNINTSYSLEVPVFHGRTLPEKGSIVGYGAILDRLALAVPIPEVLAMVSVKNKKYETDGWKVFTPKHKPEESLYKQLVFALKYEGIDLLLFKKLFEQLPKADVLSMLQLEPTGMYSRKIWFLYEWLMEEKLNIPDLTIKQAIPLIDEKLQYAISGTSSSRHRIINNLPGTINFCPLIRKTETLETYIKSDIANQKHAYLNELNSALIQRASAFLLLKDSKASFTIEGESPKSKRATRWGRAIGQAGKHPLNKEELLRLQSLVIENPRFIKMGLRELGGFVGEHDRITNEPLPDHISAKPADLDKLIDGLLTTNAFLSKTTFDPVMAAALVSFGFVFIHPFVDGNGRIHRYLIHHILAVHKFSQQGIIFPISASILDHIAEYRRVLESFSLPVLELIEWEATSEYNVTVMNETLDYYRYFDATKQAEFLYDCVRDTIEHIIPEEVNYLRRYDAFKQYVDRTYEMPDKLVATLVRFLEQQAGKLSKRARSNEFKLLTDEEVVNIEQYFEEIFEL